MCSLLLTHTCFFITEINAEEVDKTAVNITKPSNMQSTPASTDKVDNKPSADGANGTVDVPLPVSTDELNARDINHYIEPQTVTPLLVGAKEVITLITTDTSYNSKGVAILLPDWQQMATNPKGLNFLRKKLPDQGWTTISIQPPSRPENYPSQALKASVQEDENSKILEDYQEELSQIMAAVMKKASEYPGIFIVITQGNHGALLTDLYQKGKNESPSAFIVLSSYMPTLAANQQYARALSETDFPVLDLYLSKDHPLAKSSADLRLTATKKAMKAYYRQAELKNIKPGYYPETNLVSAINGWLTKVGW
jgi:hypothetical protein